MLTSALNKWVNLLTGDGVVPLPNNPAEEDMSGTIKANKVYGEVLSEYIDRDKHKRQRVKELNLKRRISKDARVKKHTNEGADE